MESLGPEASFVDDLLDFSSDIGEDDEDNDDDRKPRRRSSSSSSLLVGGGQSRSFSDVKPEIEIPPPVVEEELEWISNKDLFPGLETFVDYLPNNIQDISNRHSPISVLENSSNSNSSSSNNSNNSHSSSWCGGNFPVLDNPPPPRRARSKRRHRRQRCFPGISAQLCLINSQVNSNSNSTNYNSNKDNSAANGPTIGRKCQHCQAEKTPQWRAGPLGPKTLCNACGVRYKSGRLVPEYRPASSPTFSSKVHSNSHRKIMEMRRLKQRDTMLRPCG